MAYHHTQLKRSADMLAGSLDKLAETFIASEELRPFEALSLMVGAELIRTVPLMKLAEAITGAQKKFESFATSSESNQTKQQHTTEEMKMKKAKGKTKNRVSNSGPGTPSGKHDLQSNGCGAHSCGAVTHSTTGKPASDKEVATAEASGQEIPEVF